MLRASLALMIALALSLGCVSVSGNKTVCTGDCQKESCPDAKAHSDAECDCEAECDKESCTLDKK